MFYKLISMVKKESKVLLNGMENLVDKLCRM